MQRHLVVFLRIVCLAGLLLGVSFLYRLLLASGRPPSVFDTVYAQCIVILVSLVYYCLGKFCLAACFPPKHRPRRVSLVPRDADGNYVDMQLTTATEVIRGAPRLNLQNVWVFVYGVGFILFIAGYCVLNLNPLCLASFGVGVGILALDELVCPRHTLSKLYTSVRVGSLLTGLVSMVLVSIDLFRQELLQFTSTIDLYSFVYGVCLPIASQFLMIAVRDSRRFAVGSVVEVCEFGLPFTAFLGVFHLTVAYGQRFQLEGPPAAGSDLFLNASWARAAFSPEVRSDGPFVLFYALTPLLVGPSVVGYVSCVLEGSSVDPMLAAGLALCVHFLMESNASALGIYGTVCACVAIGIRVLGECSPQLLPPPQTESGQLDQQVVWEREARQLDQQVVWEREARRAAVADELTRELGEPEHV